MVPMNEEPKSIRPNGNGNGSQPNPGGLLRELARRTRGDEKRGVVDAFLTSDKNNPAKSRIPSAAGMSVYQMLGLWGSTKKDFYYPVQGKVQKFKRNVSGNHMLFKMLYDENAISQGGQSRQEGMTVGLGYLIGNIDEVNDAKNRLGEAGGAKKK